MDRVRTIFHSPDAEQEYEPLERDEEVRRPVVNLPGEGKITEPYSRTEYFIFIMLGISQLWAWNMFLAAAPYFQSRFRDNKQILDSFQSAIVSVGCVTNLFSTLILSRLQLEADYPRRIIVALLTNLAVFTLLSISTVFTDMSSVSYLSFTLFMVFSTSVATGLCQNGAFAFASSFGRPEYIQGIMTGQAIAGVLPVIAQIASVWAIPTGDRSSAELQVLAEARTTTNSAFIYFLTAAAVSVITLFVTMPLVRKHKRITASNMMASIDTLEQSRRSVGMRELYRKLFWLAASVFMCFAVTMFFPVFTSKVLSVVPEAKAPRGLTPPVFIPLGFLVWNAGDLAGRLSTGIPYFVTTRPRLLFFYSVLRIGFLPLYYLCNIDGKGAIIKSDVFYLGIVQLFFGATNGWLGSLCMMDAGKWVEEEEREAAGSFMVLNLVGGLTAGSLLSFAVANAH
ncbi:hypothetical protein HYFRA_00009221 [Hymenoscyphus fraxineus]|uniref:Nucleoside transporter family n=1 Tax=Hymenoscyphus fraxineus TaxID=746836 RepID=A0A9N9KZ46_9HELO|nr:hypothetical protein HYFRA_00009221 [Hymenoscyphus fraxineus]